MYGTFTQRGKESDYCARGPEDDHKTLLVLRNSGLGMKRSLCDTVLVDIPLTHFLHMPATNGTEAVHHTLRTDS